MKELFVSLIFIVSTCHLLAQEIVMITQPAANKVGMQDAFEVKYIIKNANQVESFNLPKTNDLTVLSGPSQSSHTSIINGERSMSYELTYVMKANHKGKVVIPGGIANSRGREYKSNSVSIEVIEGTVRAQQPQRNRRQQQVDPFDDPFFNQDPFSDDFFAAMQRQQRMMMEMLQGQGGMPNMNPQSGQVPRQRDFTPATQKPEIIKKEQIPNNIFIKVDVDKTNVNLGEQITATYKLYSRLPMEVNLTKLPSLNGFWSQDFKIPQPAQAQKEFIDGKEYQVFEIKKSALFPTQVGQLELDVAQAEGKVQILNPHQIREEDPFDAFTGGARIVTKYEYETVPVKLKSQAIKINVSSLPNENKPQSFDGAIGQYTIESNIDKTELTTDDNATITLRVSGTGNLKLIGTPKINWPKELDPFDPMISDTITNTNNIIAGYKTFEYTFGASAEGNYTIPPTEFSFYDPSEKSYKTLKTPSYSLHVLPGKNYGNSAKGKLPKEIHDIYSKPLTIKKSSNKNFPASPLFWSGFGVPLLAYIGLAIFRKKEDELRSNQVLFKNKRASKIALKRLSLAETYLKKTAQNEFYEETAKVVWLYLSDKLSIPLAMLSKEVAAQKMQEKNISSELQNELFRITNECEMALYSPESGSMKMHQTYNDAFKLIGKLEDNLS